jgi:hypothetical protein
MVLTHRRVGGFDDTAPYTVTSQIHPRGRGQEQWVNCTDYRYKITPPGTPHSPALAELATPMDRYARLWMLSDRKQMFAVAIIPEGRGDPSPHS